jgi:hypothetical protein
VVEGIIRENLELKTWCDASLISGDYHYGITASLLRLFGPGASNCGSDEMKSSGLSPFYKVGL